MTLTPGTRLGPYEIASAIGAGGMGEVYRATDSRLGRDVAIKVLPAGLADDPERLQRFEQEARAAAALNHPNILALYDIGTNADAPYLVTELLEGSTLREQLTGPLPVRKALDFAVQIARGLAAAHEKGIVHRDLKPENLFVTDDGRVKILDFGLAKLTQAEPSVRAVSVLPTVLPTAAAFDPAQARPKTIAGTVLGTVGYMSPEQVRGVAADHRSDLFAFGTVLYEMLSGQRAFRGETTMDTMTAIVKDHPQELPATERKIPLALVRIIERCLEKSPAARFQSTRDLAFALEALSTTSTPSGAAETIAAIAPVRSGPHRLRTAAALVAAVVVGAVVTALGTWLLRPAPVEAPEVRLQMVTPTGFPTMFAIAPDGRAIVFVAAAEGKTEPQLWLRSLDADSAQPLPGTEGAAYPFWSADSRSIGFRVGGVALKRVDLDGRTTRTIVNGPGVVSAWGADGTILFSAGTTGPLSRVPASGGQAVEATRLESPQQTSHRLPRFLPDGRHFLFYVLGTPEARGVYVGTLDSRETRRLFDADSQAEFVSPDYLMFMRQEALLAQRLNLETFDTIGEPIVFGDGTATDGVVGHMALSASSAGSLVYRAAATRVRQLVWFDRSGKQIDSIGEPDDSGGGVDADMSPDGSAVARVRSVNGNADVWLVETARGVLRRLTSDPGLDREPIWSPDGTRIAFVSMRKGPGDIFVRRASGAAPEEVLLESPINKNLYDWSPDGRFILYSAQDPRTRRDLWALPLDGDRKPFVVAQSDAEEKDGQFSKDGRWVAYASDETGQLEVFVKAFPTLGGTTRISASGGTEPRWSNDGKQIFYRAPDNRLMSAPVTMRPNGTVDVGAPVALFTLRSDAAVVASPDGQRFLFNTPLEDEVSTPLTVILNWKPKRQ